MSSAVESPTAAATAPNQSEKQAAATGPQEVPFEHCLPAPAVSAPAPTELTPEQQESYDTLLAEVRDWSDILDELKGVTKSPITDTERIFMTKECLLRYLRATKWKLPDASKRLLCTLTWRREYGVSRLTPEHISVENETGKQYILGWDVGARPCLYLNPAKQNTDASPRQVQHLVYMLERVIELTPAGQESLALVINFGMSSKHPSLATSKEVLYILQNHYPERMGRSLINNLPWAVRMFFSLITPFIDPITREKLKFNEDLRSFIPAEQLSKTHGGDCDFEYKHDVYWPALTKLCAERHQAYEDRWTKGGKVIGEREAYLKGGEGEKSISELEAAAKGAGPSEVGVPPAPGAAQAAVKPEADPTPAPEATAPATEPAKKEAALPEVETLKISA